MPLLVPFVALFSALPVSITSECEVPGADLHRAEQLAGEILGQAGFEIEWTNTPGTAIQIRILSHPLPRTQNLDETALGISLVRIGHAAIFWQRIRQTAIVLDVAPAVILGCALAHELGHLLLSSSAHSREGLMRATLTAPDFRLAAHGRLRFTASEVFAMKTSPVRDAP